MSELFEHTWQEPPHADTRLLEDAIDTFVECGESAALRERLPAGFLDGRQQRYEELVAHTMCAVDAVSFEMGTCVACAHHFCGEVPSHRVTLPDFEIGRVPVTNELFAALHSGRRTVATAERATPVGDVSWLEASLFAIWVGCRLPKEAEWEYVCGAGRAGQWCCEHEDELPAYAWYSENADGRIHPVASRRPNTLGLYDLHGNVWEWCADGYGAAFYARSGRHDPFNRGSGSGGRTGAISDRVCRGGSIYALAEMCRTRYRFHEPPDFRASDLGFRLARSRAPQTIEEDEA